MNLNNQKQPPQNETDDDQQDRSSIAASTEQLPILEESSVSDSESGSRSESPNRPTFKRGHSVEEFQAISKEIGQAMVKSLHEARQEEVSSDRKPWQNSPQSQRMVKELVSNLRKQTSPEGQASDSREPPQTAPQWTEAKTERYLRAMREGDKARIRKRLGLPPDTTEEHKPESPSPNTSSKDSSVFGSKKISPESRAIGEELVRNLRKQTLQDDRREISEMNQQINGNNVDEVGRLLAAARFAAERHTEQRRKGAKAEPYINHPLAVADILRSVGGVEDADILIAALLHDTVEDTETTPVELEDRFGKRVRALVEEVTDDKSLPKARRKELQIEHAPHLSPGAQQIKLADKTTNVSDVAFNHAPDWTLERRREYLVWSEAVVKGLRGCNEKLEANFDRVVGMAWAKLNEEGAS